MHVRNGSLRGRWVGVENVRRSTVRHDYHGVSGILCGERKCLTLPVHG